MIPDRKVTSEPAVPCYSIIQNVAGGRRLAFQGQVTADNGRNPENRNLGALAMRRRSLKRGSGGSTLLVPKLGLHTHLWLVWGNVSPGTSVSLL